MGLLDALQDPSNALGLSLLAAGSPTTDPNQAGFGMRLNAAVVDATDKSLKQQMAASQLFAAKQKAALLGLAMQDAGGAVGSPGAVLGGSPAPSQAQGGAVGSPGAVVAPTPSAQGVGGVTAPSGVASGLFNPRTAALLKLGGEADILPNIQAMQPKPEIHDGVLYDMNPITNPTLAPRGFVVAKHQSADGKSTISLADGSTVVAPGAVDAFGSFEDRSNRSKANWTESRQPGIAQSGREVSQSIGDAVTGTYPPAAIAVDRATGMAPATAPVIGRGAGYGTEGQMRGAVAGPMGADPAAAAREIAATRASLAQPGLDPQSRAMLQAHLTDLQQQAAAIPNTATPPALIGAPTGALPPPSPVVAQSGAPLIGAGAGRGTNFANLPGQGIGIGGGTKFGPAEQAAQGAAKAGAEEQAKRQADAEANPNKIMAETYPKIAEAAQAAPMALASLQTMLDASNKRKGSTVIPAPLIGMVPGNVIPEKDAYDKARADALKYMPAFQPGGAAGSTDKSRGTDEIAIPEYGIDQGVQKAAIEQRMGQVRAAQVSQQILQPYVNRADGAGSLDAHTVLSKSLSPGVANIVAPILQMPKSPARDAAIQEARKNPAAEAVLRAAIQSGALQ